MILDMCVQSSCKDLQWIYASFQAWRDVIALVLLFLYVDLIDTRSGFDIPVTITNKNYQNVREFHHGTF